jgi:hypothetical protein
LSLCFAYALSTSLFLTHLDATGVDLIQWTIVATQVIRLAAIVAYYGAKPARIEVLLVLLSFETFIVMGLIAMFILSPNAVFSQLAHTIFSTWIASLFTVLPPYMIFTGVTQMRQDRGLTAVVVPLAIEFGFLTFAASAMLGFEGTFTLGNFFDFLISSAKLYIAQGTVPGFSTLLILVPSVAMYSALLVYATIPTATSVIPPKVTFILPLLTAVVALGWVVFGVAVVPNTLLSFTAPGIIIVALLWTFMRR